MHRIEASKQRIRFAGMASIAFACLLALSCFVALGGCAAEKPKPQSTDNRSAEIEVFSQTFAAPAYEGELSIVVHDDEPDFSDILNTTAPFIEFSEINSFGQCGQAVGLLGKETLPQGPRSDLQKVTPAGFHNAEYPWIEDRWVYNRSHLIAFALGGGDANAKNLITGTYSLNTRGMLSLEERTLYYIVSTGNHVLYRVTPIYEGHEPVARGVLIEAKSVEDDGAGLSFCRFCFNVEAGVEIDYSTGYTHADGTISEDTVAEKTYIPDEQVTYVLNTFSLKFHRPDCSSVHDIKAWNRMYFAGTREEAIEMGYQPCGYCKP